MNWITLVLLSLISSQLSADIDFDKQQIQERIKPIGKVRMEQGAQPLVAAPEVKAVEGPPGKITYDQYCVVCHRDGLAGAPKFEDKNDWQKRIKGRTVDQIVASAIKGLGAMPPKGTCMDCTDADLKAAVEYMMPKS